GDDDGVRREHARLDGLARGENREDAPSHVADVGGTLAEVRIRNFIERPREPLDDLGDRRLRVAPPVAHRGVNLLAKSRIGGDQRLRTKDIRFAAADFLANPLLERVQIPLRPRHRIVESLELIGDLGRIDAALRGNGVLRAGDHERLAVRDARRERGTLDGLHFLPSYQRKPRRQWRSAKSLWARRLPVFDRY